MPGVRVVSGVAAGILVATLGGVAWASVAVTRISVDPFTNTTSQHRTEVEPDTFAFGNTTVSAFQVGRFFDGGSTDIGWATSTDGGTTWTNGFLPGITNVESPFPLGPYSRVSDPAVAHDARHGVWLISSLALTGTTGAAVLVSRSTDGGIQWSNPVTVATIGSGQNFDKEWIVCDNTTSSPFFGRCYVEWDDNGAGNRILMSTSTDGGLTWGSAKTTANAATGLGGQPVVQPNGTVIVPIDNANETAVRSFRSTNGGVSWSSTVTVASIRSHTVAGGLRSGPLISAEIDGAGKVYVVWQDCRFRSGCSANDIVMSTSTNGTTWSAVTRIPIDATNSGVDHFIPGIAVDKSTSGSTAHLGLAYYYYPTSACSASTCQLDVGFVSSSNGGASWSAPTQFAGPMSLSWLANTSQGRMVGDYISTSFNAAGTAHGVFAGATAPTGGSFNESMFTNTVGLARALAPDLGGASEATSTTVADPVLSTASDHAEAIAALTRR